MNQINLLIDWVKQLSHNIPPLSLFGDTIIGLQILTGTVLPYNSRKSLHYSEYVMWTCKYPLSCSVLINLSAIVPPLWIMAIQFIITSRVSWICSFYKYSNRLLHLDICDLSKRAAPEYVEFLVIQQIHKLELLLKSYF